MNQRPYQVGDRPIPNYTLHEFLGRGGFGEVWKATGPGGIQVAIKIIHQLDRKKGAKELRALRLLKNIRHPNLVPLLGFWLKTLDGQLISDEEAAPYCVEQPTGSALRGTLEASPRSSDSARAEPAELAIALGLCEKSLFDRLEECREQGAGNIPRQELLTYLHDAARAIDVLNSRHDIQHCDIKPHNILLLSGAAQVADFGLAKMIGGVRETSTVAGTIAYGAPELLLGKSPSQTTDQYSLAITYFELRTGALPFAISSIGDVLRAKQHGELDLSKLPADERVVIERACSIAPDQRYPSCGEMVKALENCIPAEPECAINTVHARPVVSSVHAETPRGRTEKVPLETRTPSARNWIRRPGLPVVPLIGAVAVAILLTAFIVDISRGPKPEETTSFSRAYSVIANGQTADQSGTEHTSDVDGSEINLASQHQDDGQTTTTQDNTTGTIPSTSDEPRPNEPSGEAEQATPDTSSAVELSRPVTEASQPDAEKMQQIADSAKATAENTLELAKTTKQISLSLDAIRQQLAQASNRGSLIENPQLPGDYFHNARMYEQRGDQLHARESYQQFLALRLNLVDPHLRYLGLLKLQEGVAAARQIYRAAADAQSDTATQFAAILLEPDDTRTQKLIEFSSANPEFAPAVSELSREYSAERLGTQGLADKARERELLEQFQQLVEQGYLLKYYLEQAEAAKLIEESRIRLAALRQFDPAVFKRPVRLKFMHSNSGWAAHVAIAEAARSVHYRFDESGEFECTGHYSFLDQRTGAPMPKLNIELPRGAGHTKIQLRYADIRGNEQGPFEFEFDPAIELVRSGKENLEASTKSWIWYSDRYPLIYFTHLVSYRYAIREVRYSLDSEKLDRTLPLPPDRPAKQPGLIENGDTTHIPAPASNRFLAIQLIYRDDTKSKIHRFERH
jgi:serine/threonine protein kinase